MFQWFGKIAPLQITDKRIMHALREGGVQRRGADEDDGPHVRRQLVGLGRRRALVDDVALAHLSPRIFAVEDATDVRRP